jgi:hypothetical protein
MQASKQEMSHQATESSPRRRRRQGVRDWTHRRPIYATTGFSDNAIPTARALVFASHQASVRRCWGMRVAVERPINQAPLLCQVRSTAFPKCCIRSTDSHLGALAVEHDVNDGA